MDGLSALEHGDELLDASAAGLGPLRGFDAVEDGVAISAVEAMEHLARNRTGIESCGEIGRHLDACRPGVRGVPPAVSLGALDGGKPRGLHAPLRYQPLGECDVAP